MARRKPTSIPPDLFDAIVEETERRLLEQRVLIPADLTNTHANAAYAYTSAPAQRVRVTLPHELGMKRDRHAASRKRADCGRPCPTRSSSAASRASQP